jgi:hypothetical protein
LIFIGFSLILKITLVISYLFIYCKFCFFKRKFIFKIKYKFIMLIL